MNIKKVLLTISCLLLITTVTVNAATFSIITKPTKEKSSGLTEKEEARIKALKNRVTEIQAIDRSRLSKADRKELHRELKDLKKEAKGNGKGFIIAIGGLVIVILLLI